MHIKDDHRIVSGRCIGQAVTQSDGTNNTLKNFNNIYIRYNNMGANIGETFTADSKTESIFE